MSPVDIPASLERFAAQRVEVPPWGHMCKTPEDVRRYEWVLQRVRPYLVLEMGSWNGVSARWFASRVPVVVSVELQPGSVIPGPEPGWRVIDASLAAEDIGEDGGLAIFRTGGSTDPAIIAELGAYAHEVAEMGPCLVVLDSDHEAEHVLREMEAYGHLVTPGSYLVVEDTLVRWLGPERFGWKGSPLDAVELYLRRHPGWFVVDERVDGLAPTSQFPGGWLQRVSLDELATIPPG